MSNSASLIRYSNRKGNNDHRTKGKNMNHIKQIAQGDVTALAALYEAYKAPIYRLALSMTKNRDLAEDITQDTFLKIQEKAKSYRYNGSESAWIYTIARNLAYDRLRQRRADHNTEDETLLLQIPSSEGNPENSEYLFFDLIKSLSAKDSEIVCLRILADLSFKDIGRITHASAGSCSKRYGRALDQLRMELSGKTK